jgi:hypothetical protein
VFGADGGRSKTFIEKVLDLTIANRLTGSEDAESDAMNALAEVIL